MALLSLKVFSFSGVFVWLHCMILRPPPHHPGTKDAGIAGWRIGEEIVCHSSIQRLYERRCGYISDLREDWPRHKKLFE
jgi:hypothetical protein